MDPASLSDDAQVSWRAGRMGASPARRADGFRASQLRNRRLDVQDHSFELKITPAREAKTQRIPDGPDRMIAANPG